MAGELFGSRAAPLGALDELPYSVKTEPNLVVEFYSR
jgi:hypothetical protein